MNLIFLALFFIYGKCQIKLLSPSSVNGIFIQLHNYKENQLQPRLVITGKIHMARQL